ncbi:hypothetical protein VEE71_40730 [Escherichia coli]|nr:hypothetical protein VEGS02_40910 [Escherichia coli]BED15350.1 hypothetical protein VEE71_40730 [Escherichia coli]
MQKPKTPVAAIRFKAKPPPLVIPRPIPRPYVDTIDSIIIFASANLTLPESESTLPVTKPDTMPDIASKASDAIAITKIAILITMVESSIFLLLIL